ncbi:MAG TPA: tRNA (N6-isopentenyl adenosine(37)-C2)-methylthiotransferase MiaB, partial [Smithellaceae bacterium]|nr:tRNA (N6-isopentenyl adenosine(37)-C2)-methylthiotransferase MiaB [Smithellaceae bacterium]
MGKKHLYIETFGCQMNVHDSRQMAVLMEAEGYELSGDARQADLILMNTCSIRQKAQQKALSELGRLVKLKQKKPALIIGFGGCLAQHMQEKIYKRFAGVDFVFGTHNIHRLPLMVDKVVRDGKKITETGFLPQITSINIYAPPAKGAVSSFVSIMQGCDNYCAYCVV